jgi:hypothetical protein
VFVNRHKQPEDTFPFMSYRVGWKQGMEEEGRLRKDWHEFWIQDFWPCSRERTDQPSY